MLEFVGDREPKYIILKGHWCDVTHRIAHVQNGNKTLMVNAEDNMYMQPESIFDISQSTA
jgi:hypothetical protein